MSIDLRSIRNVCALDPVVGDMVYYAVDIHDNIAIYTEDGWKEINSQPYKIKGEVINVKSN